MKKILLAILSIALFIILANAVLTMPDLGSLNNPAYNATTIYYIQNAVRDTGATNIIAAIITDFRAFDTLGETIVLFTSIIAVVAVLTNITSKKEQTDHE
jgi:multisubunit Na+/H+ antiporter MnhB subunit